MLTIEVLSFLDRVFECFPFKGPFLSLGSMNMMGPQTEWDSYFRKEGHLLLLGKKDIAALLKTRYRIGQYCDLDLNGDAGLKVDLSKPVPSLQRGKWTTIYNGGTLEHIFDIATAFRNVHALCAPGGMIIHSIPITWLNHGFYNLTPELLFAIADLNGYRLISSAFYFWVGHGLRQKKRLFGIPWKSNAVFKGLVMTEINGRPTKDAHEIFTSLNGDDFPLQSAFLVAFVKEADNSFRDPYQVCDASGSMICSASAFDVKQAVVLEKPFECDAGFSWKARIHNISWPSDNMCFPWRSRLVLLEDGKPIWMRHSQHNEIRQRGGGRFSHWNNELLFSATDNSNPNRNGRIYQIVLAETAR